MSEDHIKHWEALAVAAENEAARDRAAGRDLSQPGQSPGDHRARSYRRLVEALRLEASTGIHHCSCCLKPTGAGRVHP